MLRGLGWGEARQLENPSYTGCMPPRRMLVLACLLAAIAGPALAFAQAPANDKPPAFEVAAIKLTKPEDNSHNWNGTRDRISIENYTLRALICSAYGLKSDTQVLGGPDWLDKQAFDITAKIEDADLEKMRSMTPEDRQKKRNQMLQSLLAERFQLKVHSEQRTMPVYALVQTKSGAKLTPAAAATPNTGHSLLTSNGRMTALAISMDSLADDLTRTPETGNRVVLNHTGLTGDYDFKLNWSQDWGSGTPPDAELPGLFTALEEQLGLKLQSEKGSVPVVVIDSAEKPTID
jgi:uncharacterized protein (TIGR03435 family)